ncbi:MAG: hypothetical protein AAB682_01915 [Patescibacteria group bacterium]
MSLEAVLEFFIGGLFDAVGAAILTASIYLPIFAGIIAWRTFVRFRQDKFLADPKNGNVLLEIKLPPEITKTPRAMEYALNVFHQSSPTDWYAHYFEGKLRASASLEIISDGGKIRFFINCRKGVKNLVESSMYAQYPLIQLEEVDDYTKSVPFGSKGSDWEIWATEYKFTKKGDNVDAYPIRTYVDIGMDKEGTKEEFKTDPLTGLLEFMSALGPGEKFWFQVVITAAGGYSVPWYVKKNPDFAAQAKSLIEDLSKRKLYKNLGPEDRKLISLAEGTATPGERALLESVERNLSKISFYTGMRSIYMGKGDKFNGSRIAGVIGFLRPFSAGDYYNGFKITQYTGTDFPWQDPFGIKVAKKKRELFAAFVKRAFFYPPFDRHPMILTAEEIATMYHLPGQVASTPTLNRIESKRSEAPGNLPV